MSSSFVETWLGPLCAFGSSCTWAVASARYARAGRVLGGAGVNLTRVALAVVLFGGAMLVLGRGFPEIPGAQLGWLLVSVIGSYALGDNVFLAAVSRVGFSTAMSIGCTYPLWAALGGALWGGEPLTAMGLGGVCVTCVGVIYLVRLQKKPEESLSLSHRGLGIALALATSVLWAINSTGVKRGAAGLPLIEVSVVRYAFAFVLLLPQPWLMVRLGAGPQAHTRADRNLTLARLLPVAAVEVVLGSAFYVYGLSHSSLAVGATLSALAPVVSLPVAAVTGEERIDVHRAAGVAVTALGVVLLVLG